MKPDYKNWIPKGMLFSLIAGNGAVPCAAARFRRIRRLCERKAARRAGRGIRQSPLSSVQSTPSGACMPIGAFPMTANASSQSRSLTARRSISRCPEGGVGLDIGCGSGALTIACAKRNPAGENGRYRPLGQGIRLLQPAAVRKKRRCGGCEKRFVRRGNAVKLDFPDESFDAVTSNYVYHNIAGKDKQALLLETLRVLKKGGTFAIHDLMSPR